MGKGTYVKTENSLPEFWDVYGNELLETIGQLDTGAAFGGALRGCMLYGRVPSKRLISCEKDSAHFISTWSSVSFLIGMGGLPCSRLCRLSSRARSCNGGGGVLRIFLRSRTCRLHFIVAEVADFTLYAARRMPRFEQLDYRGRLGVEHTIADMAIITQQIAIRVCPIQR